MLHVHIAMDLVQNIDIAIWLPFVSWYPSTFLDVKTMLYDHKNFAQSNMPLDLFSLTIAQKQSPSHMSRPSLQVSDSRFESAAQGHDNQ